MCGSPVCFRYSTKSIEMNHLEIYAVTMIVLFISTFTRSTIGFGDAVIAMPVLAVILGVKTATPVVALVACVISISIVYKNRTSIDFQTVLPLVVSSLLGIPIGLLILKGASETLMKTLLGFVVAGYGLFGLVKPPLTPMGERKSVTALCGFIAGILGGAYNVNGLLIAIYGAMKRWPPQQFRATMHGYFLPTGFFIMVGHGISGLWNTHVFTLFGLASPAVLLAIYLGGKLNRSLRPGSFERYVHGFLLILGVALVIRTVA
ncbi:MAG TPA: sulfite exporter TauE/SafE family protein [Desulfobacteraceae bacterium]|nr:sulfite exporter TauE/SafE family protein [Desulfobacteraceae bacterium]